MLVLLQKTASVFTRDFHVLHLHLHQHLEGGLLSGGGFPAISRVWFPKNISRIHTAYINPRDPITLSEDDWGVQSPPQQGI